jgi:predicted amidohydrolase YtcJ
MVPVGGILKGGGRVAGEGEVAGPMPNDSYFTYFEKLLTRKDRQGRVWGKDNAINRQDALKMFTTGSADYVVRPERLGSLEPGKLADLLVLDRDYMTIPDEDFHNIHALLTMVGGKVVFEQSNAFTKP